MQIITKKKAKTKTFHAVTFDIRDTGSVSQSSLIFWFLSTVYYKLLMRLKLQEFANFEYQRYRKCESVFRHLLISLHSVLQTPDEIETSRICQFWIEAAKSQKWYQKLWQTVIFWFLSTVYYKPLMRLKLQEFANFESKQRNLRSDIKSSGKLSGELRVWRWTI